VESAPALDRLLLGWSPSQRASRLGLVVNNIRFLILPHVRVPHLATHSGADPAPPAGRLEAQIRDGSVPGGELRGARALCGVCYRAANWILAGQSCGRSGADRDHTITVPLKDIYLYSLVADFRQQLCA
jgi:hypothetical protein